jgi:hypothetical protein
VGAPPSIAGSPDPARLVSGSLIGSKQWQRTLHLHAACTGRRGSKPR